MGKIERFLVRRRATRAITTGSWKLTLRTEGLLFKPMVRTMFITCNPWALSLGALSVVCLHVALCSLVDKY
jgi:hypothetical protein